MWSTDFRLEYSDKDSWGMRDTKNEREGGGGGGGGGASVCVCGETLSNPKLIESKCVNNVGSTVGYTCQGVCHCI